MFDLAAHIEYLLISHDCVVAPGLGAFLVHETPAYYDSEHCRFNPPMRSLGFNAAVTINDGLLAESVARRERVSLDEARVRVESAVASFRSQLEQSGTLPVGNIGMMTMQDGALLFEPSVAPAPLMRYMGLGSLNIEPLVSNTSDDRDDNYEAPERRNIISLTLKIAASVMIAVMACGIFFTTDNLIGNCSANYASLDSGLRAHVGNVGNPSPVQTSESLSLSREIRLNIAMPAPEAETTPAPETVEPVKPTTGRYILVVASFADMGSAMKHIGDDNRLSVIEMDGNYRVYAAITDTNAKAHVLADSLREEFPYVWICRR